MLIRPLRANDVDALVPLCHQLGYPSTREQLAIRLEPLLASANDGVFGAESDGEVVGWVHVQGRLLLEKEPGAEVCSLVVLEQHRGHGVGHALMKTAESWARERGSDEVFLRSNVIRLETHAFYKRIGYTITKTSHLFSKSVLEPNAGSR